MLKAKKILSTAAAFLFCVVLGLYALLCFDPLRPPLSLVYAPTTIICLTLATDLIALVSFILTGVCALRRQPCFGSRAALLCFGWDLALFIGSWLVLAMSVGD